MKSQISTARVPSSKRTLGSALLVTAVALLNLATPAWTGPGNIGNPRILPPQSHPHGKTYGEWSAAWWQWCFSLPTTAHPLFDTADVSAGQEGQVWFLGGTFSPTTLPDATVIGRVNRHVTVPAGKALFFPIINNEGDNVGVEPPMSLDQLWALVSGNQDHCTELSCTIDGIPLRGLEDPLRTPYRVQSPGPFSFTLPEQDNLYQFFGYDVAGTIAPAVADGVFVFLSPLKIGQHTIHCGGKIEFTAAEDGYDFVFIQDITYHITVK